MDDIDTIQKISETKPKKSIYPKCNRCGMYYRGGDVCPSCGGRIT